ncbi:MAG: hypothetical protein HY705_08160 [Gemmatimonadetes bacterium]|nr:hypothetical protein [Gemmatimonadota bacterium]
MCAIGISIGPPKVELGERAVQEAWGGGSTRRAAAARASLVEDLVAALDAHRVPEREKNELLTALGALRPQIVGQ